MSKIEIRGNEIVIGGFVFTKEQFTEFKKTLDQFPLEDLETIQNITW